MAQHPATANDGLVQSALAVLFLTPVLYDDKTYISIWKADFPSFSFEVRLPLIPVPITSFLLLLPRFACSFNFQLAASSDEAHSKLPHIFSPGRNHLFNLYLQTFCCNFICRADLSVIPTQGSCIALAAQLSSHDKQRIASGNLHSCLILLPSNGHGHSRLAPNAAITPASDSICHNCHITPYCHIACHHSIL